MELLRGVAATLRLPGPDQDPVAFTKAPKVTVTRDSDGAEILTEVVATEHGEGEDLYFTVDIPGPQIPEVDLLTAKWSDGSSSYVTHAEVVGGFVTSLKSIAVKAGLNPMPPSEELAAIREIALRSIEEACGVALRPRYQRDVLDGTGKAELLLSRPRVLKLLAVSVGGEPVDLTTLTLDPSGILVAAVEQPSPDFDYGFWRFGHSNVEVLYVHGYESFPPAELPVRDLAAYLLTPKPTDWNERATSVSNEFGSYALVTPGLRGASFPLPSVNAFIEEHRYSAVG